MASEGKFTEVQKDLWSFYKQPSTYVFISTNGSVKQSNDLIMGRGCAFEAKERNPGISAVIGEAIKRYGNQVMWFEDFKLGILPSKDKWYLKSNLSLIEQTLQQLVNLVQDNRWPKVVIPKLGCGNGGLDWESQVKPLMEKYLDDRFIVVYK